MNMRIETWHPAIVHFPIALLATGVVLGLIGSWLKKDLFKSMGSWLIGIGVLAAAAAVITGLMAEESIPPSGHVHEILEKHELFGFITLGIFAVLAVGWLLARAKGKVKLVPLLHVLGVIGVGMLLTTGYFGGHMVYDHGAGVQRDGVSVMMLDTSAVGGPATQPDSHEHHDHNSHD